MLGPFDGFCGFFAANEADKELFELQDPFKDWFKPGQLRHLLS